MRAGAFHRDDGIIQRLGGGVLDLGARLGIAQQLALLIDGFEHRHFVDDIDRFEIGHRFERQRTFQRTAVAAGQHVVHGLQRDARNALLEYLVEIVAIDIDDLAILVLRQRHFRVCGVRIPVAGQVGENADHERQLAFLDGSIGMHVVGDAHTWWTHPQQLLLNAFAHSLVPIQGCVDIRCVRLADPWRLPDRMQPSTTSGRSFANATAATAVSEISITSSVPTASDSQSH